MPQSFQLTLTKPKIRKTLMEQADFLAVKTAVHGVLVAGSDTEPLQLCGADNRVGILTAPLYQVVELAAQKHSLSLPHTHMLQELASLSDKLKPQSQ